MWTRSLPADQVQASRLTVPDLFADIERNLAKAPFYAHACFDADLGYPRRYGADFNQNVADDEVSHTIALVSVN